MYTFLTIISIPILILIRIWTRKFSINKELKEFWNFNMEILEKYVQRNENPIFYENRLFLWKINYEDVRNALSCYIGEDQDLINPSGARFHIYEKWKKEQDAFEDAVPEEIRKKYQQLIFNIHCFLHLTSRKEIPSSNILWIFPEPTFVILKKFPRLLSGLLSNTIRSSAKQILLNELKISSHLSDLYNS